MNIGKHTPDEWDVLTCEVVWECGEGQIANCLDAFQHLTIRTNTCFIIAMLDDTQIDCVYIALPNTLHFEWAMRALKAGKHVLLEKPAVINAAEAEVLFSQPSTTVILEATHSLFHPAFSAFISYLAPGEIAWARTCILAPRGVWPADDMRFNYDLGGGALADMGPYTLGALLKVFGTTPTACEKSTIETHASGIDESCKAQFRFPNGGLGEVYVNLRSAWVEGISPDAEAKMRPIVVNAEDAGLVQHTLHLDIFFILLQSLATLFKTLSGREAQMNTLGLMVI
jgi:predicted dehydrogenase